MKLIVARKRKLVKNLFYGTKTICILLLVGGVMLLCKLIFILI